MKKWFWMKPSVTDEDKKRTEEAEKDLEHRKRRGTAIEAEINGIIKRNHFAEKFHDALTGGKR